MFDLQLISAEVLKLRRRRGMLAIAVLLTLGIVALVFAVMAIQHAGNPVKYGPAGGAASYLDGLEVMCLMALVVGVVVGGTAGTQDIESGVFRDLAATGRSRLALYGARVTGAWAIVAADPRRHRGRAGRPVDRARRDGGRARRGRADRRHRGAARRRRAQHRDGRRPVGARRLARPRDRHPAGVLPGDPDAAGRDRLPRRRAPGHPGARDRPRSATSPGSRACRSRSAPRSP